MAPLVVSVSKKEPEIPDQDIGGKLLGPPEFGFLEYESESLADSPFE